ncbi:MAG: dimodular nonribosomal peptide synthase [Rhodospirillales bacterium]|nr:dimodular nonribosomal peptide synthase [Rhodospirillales bacterium]
MIMDTLNRTEELIPLSAAQRGLWFAQKLGSSDSIFNLAEAIEIHGPIDPALFEESLRQAAAEADTVRVRFVEDINGPRQTVAPGFAGLLPVIDVSAEADPRVVAERWMMEELTRPVDLLAGPLWTSALFKAAPDRFFWYHRSHHIVMDGFAGGLFARRVASIYTARAEGRPIGESPFGSLSVLLGEEAAYRSSQRFARDRQFWMERFADRPEPFSLASRQSPNVGGLLRRTAHLPSEGVAALRVAAQAAGASLPQILIAATAAYLHRVTGVEDLVIGLPVTARANERQRSVPGMVANAVPLRLSIDPEMTVEALLREVGRQVRQILRHQCYRYEDLRRDLDLLADNRQLFTTVINIEPFDYDLRFAGHPVTPHNLSNGTAEDLAIFVYDRGDGKGLRIDFDANPALYDANDLADHQRRFLRLLELVGGDPRRPIGQLDILDARERHRLLVEWNDTVHAVPRTTLPALIEAQAARTPAAIALVCQDGSFTYAELNARANRLARLLIAQGAGPEQIVALALPRSAEMVVALVAILKSGAAYLPIDPDLPSERIAFMLDDAGPARLLTTATLAWNLPGATPRLLLDDAGTIEDFGRYSDTDPGDAERTAPLSPENPAYVIYTSGSTGRPKGVVVTHGAIVNRLRWMQAEYGLAADDRVLQKTPSGFDVSVWEFFWPLIDGATLVIAKPEGHKDPAYLTALIRHEGITTIHFVPSMLQAFLQDPGAAHCDGLRRVICSGEALTAEVQAQFAATLAVPLHNLYGPTEAAVDVTSWACRPDAGNGPVPIGRPIWNIQIHILDSGLQPVPVGGSGELYIAGSGLARGYLNRPDLTAQRFVANPYGAPGSRLYRTGDLARRRADGVIEFLGRTDEQVKIRGFRIEVGEIETILASYPGIERVVVVAREDGFGGRRLVAYIVAGPAYAHDDDRLREHLARSLPEHMIPSAFVVLDSLPLSPNGKLDRKSLPSPEWQAASGYTAPRTPTEKLLADLWAETFELEQVGVHDNFFKLGGHSLLVIRLISKIRAAFAIDLPLATLFEVSTIAGLAERIDQAQSALPGLRPFPRPSEIPLSFAQHRLWFLDQLEGPSPTYNITLGLRLSGPLDRSALEAALSDLVERHESLRTVFPDTTGTPRQLVLDPADARPILAVQPVSEEALPEILNAAACRGFDLAGEIPLRASLFVLAPQEHVLLLLVHHIAGDGWSLAPLARDLAASYAARRLGVAPDWAPLPVQYADYTLWQHQLLGSEDEPGSPIARQLAFWTATLQDLPDQIALPTDHPRPAISSYRGATVSFRITPKLHDDLLGLARSSHASLFMVLQAGLVALLNRLGAGTDIPIGSPIAGRTDEALDELIGFFVNTLVLRTDTSGDPSFQKLVERVRDANLAAYGNQDLPFERLVEIVNPVRSRARHPLFQIMLAFQNTAGIGLDLPDLVVASEPVDIGIAKFDLSFILSERHADGCPDGIEGAIEYRTDLFERETVERIAGCFVRLLEAAILTPEGPIGQIDILDTRERHRLLVEWNDTARAMPRTTLPALIEAQAARAPAAIALVCEDASLSYAEINARANRLARLLIAQGAGPEQIVAVAVPRSAEMIIALVAILKSGAAYLPIDPDLPSERIAVMLEDARPARLLTTAALARDLPGVTPRVLLDDAATIEELERYPDADPSDAERTAPLSPESPAYVIYTSGSTGKPKGVVVTHLGIPSLVASQIERFAITPDSRVLQLSSASFDASIMDVLMALPAGAALVVPPPGPLLGDALAEVLTRYAVSHALVPPAALASVPAGGFEHLTTLVVGGDACPADLVGRWSAGRRMVNAYGPTETTICTAMSMPLSGAAAPPIGRPIRNVRVYVLNEGLQPVPVGVAGELYIAGPCLARGYLDRPALTAERFVANPFDHSGGRMYRTGDLVRWREAGTLEFLGRADHQVKIRGFRIELGEIEAALADHTGVAQAAVIARDDASGDRRLVAYVVPAASDAPEPADLRRHLAQSLPAYMLPAAFVMLDRLPLTPSGKLDRKALPAPDVTAQGATFRAPRTPREEILCALFAETLGVPRVGIDDDFFELGGHSLLAVRLGGRIRERMQPDFPITGVYTAPVVRELAALLDGGLGSAEVLDLSRDAVLPEHIKPHRERPPLHADRIFLTGATGFVGSHLLATLLRETDARVFCHVRGASPQAAMLRLRRALDQRGLSAAWDENRIDLLTGDLGHAGLGLGEGGARVVRHECGAIYHCGADVDFLRHYTALKPANVDSVVTLLDWTARGRPKSLHYVSTMAVIDHTSGRDPISESSDLRSWRGLVGAYSQSKWVGDTLARQAQARGLPVAIYRLAAVTGDRLHAICNETDLIWRLVRIYADLEAIPDLDLPLNLTPADDVARAIVRLSRNDASMGNVHHLLSGAPLHLRDVPAAFERLGLRLDRVPVDRWMDLARTRLAETCDDSLAAVLSIVAKHNGAAEYPPVFSDVTRARLETVDATIGPVDAALLQRYLLGLGIRAPLSPSPAAAREREAGFLPA